ncbi:CBS domain-containing protein [Oligoflexia bacterium]|nr:CBS domain-containing protein [Oligoflexia bacterium]
MKNFSVTDVMQTDCIKLKAEMALYEALRLLLREGCSGAPVLNSAGEVLGVLTLKEIVYALFDTDKEDDLPEGPLSNSSDRWRSILKEQVEELESILVEEVMNADVETFSPSDSVSTVAAQMHFSGTELVIVVDRERFVGVVSWRDLVQLLEDH